MVCLVCLVVFKGPLNSGKANKLKRKKKINNNVSVNKEEQISSMMVVLALYSFRSFPVSVNGLGILRQLELRT